MTKQLFSLLLAFALCFCPAASQAQTPWPDATIIILSDEAVLVNGQPASAQPGEAVYTAHDIVFYPEGQNFTYGEGEAHEAHPQEEADQHTVVHITRPGTYVLSGQMSAGQVAVEIENGKADPEAVVTLVLNGVDLTCTVAPAVIFYDVYECGTADPETASMTVDTSAAGANVIIADDTENLISGSHVARIYKPGTVTLSEDGASVLEAEKLHKYDGAFYSRRSMNVTGGEKGNGVLAITADNEGLDSELHLTLNGGDIRILAGNDGINTNEDNVSVTTVNGGSLNITVTGSTGEGDGIDSNGWLVINGGSVTSAACGFSGDAGVDSDLGIYVNGGELCATGNMFDHIAGGGAACAVFSFDGRVPGGSTIALKTEAGETVQTWTPANDFSYLVLSGTAIQPGRYTLWQDDQQLASTGSTVTGFGGPGGMTPPDMPEGFEKDFEKGFGKGFDPSKMTPPEGFDMPEGMEPPAGFDPSQMTPPEGFDMPEGMEPPAGFDPSQMTPPEGMERSEGGGRGFDGRGGHGGFGREGGDQPGGEQQTVFTFTAEGGTFSGVGKVKAE